MTKGYVPESVDYARRITEKARCHQRNRMSMLFHKIERLEEARVAVMEVVFMVWSGRERAETAEDKQSK